MADRLDPLPTGTPLTVAAGHTFDQLPAPNMVVVPGGGEPALRAMHDERLLAYLRRASAGLLVGRRATTPNEHIPTTHAAPGQPCHRPA